MVAKSYANSNAATNHALPEATEFIGQFVISPPTCRRRDNRDICFGAWGGSLRGRALAGMGRPLATQTAHAYRPT